MGRCVSEEVISSKQCLFTALASLSWSGYCRHRGAPNTWGVGGKRGRTQLI